MKLILIIKTTTIALMTDNAINDDGAVDCFMLMTMINDG